MTRHPSVHRRGARGAALAIGTCAALAVSLVGGVLAAGPASAAPLPSASAQSTPAAAATAAFADAPDYAGADIPLLGNPGSGVKIEVMGHPADTAEDPGYPSIHIGVYADGRVKLMSGGKCLDTWAGDGFQPFREVGIFGDCIENPSQAFYFVPAVQRPTAAPHTDYNDHVFYIVSQSGRKCLSSFNHGLAPEGDFGARLQPCSDNTSFQEFRILNDPLDALGVNRQWEHILGLSLKYATNHCAGYDGPDENSPCFVSTGTDPATATFSAAGSQAAADLGTLTSRSAGCGTTVSTTLPSMHNASSSPLPVKLITAGSFAHQVSISDTETTSAEYSLTVGVKDLFSETGKFGFTWQHQKVTANTSTETRTTEVDPTLQPGEWLMGTWESQVLQFTGLWKLGVDEPTTTPGAFTWYIPATSILPAALSATGSSPLTYTVVQSSTQKDCDAVPASTNALPPTLSGNAACTTAASARAGSTVYACPGTWNIPGVNPTPIYAYQWYTIAQGSTTPSAIPGATAATYSVPDQLVPPSPASAFLGVIVREIGPATRRESAPAITVATAQLQPRLAGSPQATLTNFVGSVPDASLGQQYSTPLVVNPGTGMTLSSDSSQLDGLSISADGVLSGMPSAPGDYPFTITDTPTGGFYQQQVHLTLHVAGQPTVFVPSTSIRATVGQALSLDTVTSAADGLDLSLSDPVPAGMAFDTQTGVLSGTPTAAGETTFRVSSRWSAQTFTVQVADTPTVLNQDALPTGTVGTPYDAQTVSTVGTNIQIGLVGRTLPGGVDYSPDAPVNQLGLPDLAGAGLTLNADTGAITGTPTREGSITLTVANLNDPAAAPLTKTISIAAAADGSTPVTPGQSVPAAKPGLTSLAATGSEAALFVPLAAVLLAIGAVLTIIRRRRIRG